MRAPPAVIGASRRAFDGLPRRSMPTRATTGTILTDTGCAADRNGISHCSNILRLSRITIRHDHSMMNDPCLSPGERVRVKSLR